MQLGQKTGFINQIQEFQPLLNFFSEFKVNVGIFHEPSAGVEIPGFYLSNPFSGLTTSLSS